MKKIWIMIFIFLLCAAQSLAETISLVTYYLGPEGSFEEICLEPVTSNLSGPCEVGTVYFTTGGRFAVCEEEAPGIGAWFMGDIWEQDNDDVFLKDTVSNPGLFVGLGIGTNTPEFKLTVEDRAGIIAKGTFGSGDAPGLPPAGGGATTLFWHPRSAAFHVGSTNGMATLGDFSTSFGKDTRSEARYSISAGDTSAALERGSVAIGYETTANGECSVAMNHKSTANGINASALGAMVDANGDASTAFGVHTEANGHFSFVFGDSAVANGQSSVAMASLGTANGHASFTLSGGSTANDQAAFALGRNSLAGGRASFALGEETEANGHFSIASGYRTVANGEGSVAMGNNNRVDGERAMVMGNQSVVTGDNSVAMGYGLSVSSATGFACGQYNEDPGTDVLFMVGNGTDAANRNNALIVLAQGSMGIGTNDPGATALNVQGLPEHADNAAARAAGHTVGAVYRTGDVLKIVH
jgi:hypothetical protein